MVACFHYGMKQLLDLSQSTDFLSYISNNSDLQEFQDINAELQDINSQ